MTTPDTPYTREEMYLSAIADGDSSGIPAVPYTRKEQYLNAIATGDTDNLPETPYTREEMYLDAIARNGGGGGGGGGGLISLAPQYQGFSYGYINGGDGTFIASGSRDTYLNVLDVESGKTYVFFMGATIGNRFRPSFFTGKTYEDFAPYITEPFSGYTLGGQYLLGSGDPGTGAHPERVYFTPSADGVIVIGTSNDGTIANAYFLQTE